MAETLDGQDFQMWLKQTIHQLQNRDFAALDIENLIKELAELGQSEKRRLEQVLDEDFFFRINPLPGI